jgi:hypothetical protein
MSRRARAVGSGSIALALPLALALSLALAQGCSDPPVPIPSPKPQVAPADGVLVAGRVRLRGALAERYDGVLWLSLVARGQRMPIRFRAFALTSGDISDAVAGERVLAFDLREGDVMAGGMPVQPLPAEIEVRALFDPDSMVETKDGQVAAQAPVRVGDRGVDLVLDPGPK